MANYVTTDQGKALKFGEQMRKQYFEHGSSQAKTMPEYILVKGFAALSREEKQVTVEVMQFLYNFTFASRAQLERYLRLKKVDTACLSWCIQEMVNNRQMNSFYLDADGAGGFGQAIPEDAFVLYCLDFGAVPILNHFTKQDNNVWFSTDACRCEAQILKSLKVVEFYLTLLEAQGSYLYAFNPHYRVSFKHLDFSASAQFTICRNHKYGFFLFEVVNNDDLCGYWQKKLDEKIAPFVSQEENWKKYFSSMPNFLLLVDNKEDGARAADYFFRRTEVGTDPAKNTMRILTMDQMQKGLKNAYFSKYMPNENDSGGVGELKPVRNSVLSNIASTPKAPAPASQSAS